jgi:hypothetical protein
MENAFQNICIVMALIIAVMDLMNAIATPRNSMSLTQKLAVNSEGNLLNLCINKKY